VVVCVFLFVVVVLMLNILIAVVSDSYDYGMVRALKLFLRARTTLAAELQSIFIVYDLNEQFPRSALVLKVVLAVPAAAVLIASLVLTAPVWGAILLLWGLYDLATALVLPAASKFAEYVQEKVYEFEQAWQNYVMVTVMRAAVVALWLLSVWLVPLLKSWLLSWSFVTKPRLFMAHLPSAVAIMVFLWMQALTVLFAMAPQEAAEADQEAPADDWLGRSLDTERRVKKIVHAAQYHIDQKLQQQGQQLQQQGQQLQQILDILQPKKAKGRESAPKKSGSVGKKPASSEK